MNVKRCAKCGCKYDEDVSPHACPTKPKPSKPKTVKEDDPKKKKEE